MSRIVECPVCGKMTLKLWREKHEFWGSPAYEEMEECLNPNCGEETDEESEEE